MDAARHRRRRSPVGLEDAEPLLAVDGGADGGAVCVFPSLAGDAVDLAGVGGVTDGSENFWKNSFVTKNNVESDIMQANSVSDKQIALESSTANLNVKSIFTLPIGVLESFATRAKTPFLGSH